MCNGGEDTDLRWRNPGDSLVIIGVFQTDACTSNGIRLVEGVGPFHEILRMRGELLIIGSH